MTPTITDVAPLRKSWPMLNSRPSENMSRMTPSSANVWIVAASAKSGNRGVRPDHHAGEQIAEHDGLAQSLEDDGRHRRYAQHQRERAQENVGVVHPAALACESAAPRIFRPGRDSVQA